MDKQKADILQIQKYLRGELDAKGMHQLEREAQHDPFLMDALEGFQQAGTEQQGNLDNLASKLQQRIQEKPERRIIPVWMFAAAAGVIGFLIIVGVLYRQQNSAGDLPVAQNNTAKPAKSDRKIVAPTISADTTPAAFSKPHLNDMAVLKPKAIGRGTVTRDYLKKVPSPATVEEPPAVAEIQTSHNALNEVSLDERVMDAVAKGNDVTKDSAAMPATVAITKKPLSQPIIGKAQGASVKEREGKKEYNNSFYLGTLAPPPPKDIPKTIDVTKPNNNAAIVTTANTGLAANNAAGTSDNAKVINADANSAYGYSAPANVNTLKADSGVYANNRMQRQVKVLKPSTSTPQSAHPVNGWPDYTNYVAQHMKLPVTANSGILMLNFVVDSKGTLLNPKIVKSLNPEADKQALNLLLTGPKWLGNANGKPEAITLSFIF